MTFVQPGDPRFKRAKQARRGKLQLDARYDGFVARFTGRFGVAPLWLEPDHVESWGGRTFPKARLDVVLERTKQYEAFCNRGGSYNAAKQRAVATMFTEELAGTDLRPLFGLSRDVSRADLDEDGIFVCFSQLESVAKQEAHQLVTTEELAGFEASLGLGDAFWCTQRLWGPPIVFVRTRAQAAALLTDRVRERWADAYFELVGPHDEFGYLDRAEIAIHVDSKESFDRDYESNWYYYFK